MNADSTDSIRLRAARPAEGGDAIAKMRAEKLSAWFGSKQALREITLPLVERKVTAVIGPSGCGKSTFIRCLNRMHEVVAGARTAGEVLLDARSIY
ncbi:MAG: Phosphate transport ATP-binding protein PstB, partial [Labilithrix sp.]|nr:Phosphate transport ATP-binding protein PstB [Labilithrix sp.]